MGWLWGQNWRHPFGTTSLFLLWCDKYWGNLPHRWIWDLYLFLRRAMRGPDLLSLLLNAPPDFETKMYWHGQIFWFGHFFGGFFLGKRAKCGYQMVLLGEELNGRDRVTQRFPEIQLTEFWGMTWRLEKLDFQLWQKLKISLSIDQKMSLQKTCKTVLRQVIVTMLDITDIISD